VLKEAGLGKALLYRYFGDFVGLARAWAEGETFLPKPRELLIVELLRSSPVTDALDDMRARFGRELRGFVTAAMICLALRADAVPDYYGLKLADCAVSASGPASRPPRPRP